MQQTFRSIQLGCLRQHNIACAPEVINSILEQSRAVRETPLYDTCWPNPHVMPAMHTYSSSEAVSKRLPTRFSKMFCYMYAASEECNEGTPALALQQCRDQ